MRQLLTLIFFCAALGSAAPLCAQTTTAADTTDTTETPRPHSLKRGSWALMFQVNSNVALERTILSIQPFQSGVFGKYHFTNRDAIRAGIDFKLDTRKREDNATFGRSFESWNRKFSLLAQYVFYPAPEAVIHFYFGGGPTAGFSSGLGTATNTSVDSLGNPIFYPYRVEDSEWSVGLSGLFGIEWFATKHLSLLAEHRGALNYTNRQSSEKWSGYFNRQDTAFREFSFFYSGTLALGASVYF